MHFFVSLLFLLLLATAASAQSCGSGSTISFQADTERGFPLRPQGIIVKLKQEQCGFTALWVAADLIGPATEHCKFGQVMSVAGTESKPVPSGGPFGGTMLVVTKLDCPR